MLSAALATAPAAFASGIGVTDSVNTTGYLATGQQFRYVQTEVTLPTNAGCAQLEAVVATNQISESYYSVNAELGAQTGGNDEGVGIAVTDFPSRTGCVAFGVSFINGGGEPPPRADLEPSPGDTLVLSAYYDSATDKVSASVQDLTSGQSDEFSGTTIPEQVYTSAEVWAQFGSFTPPASQFRAFEFTGSAVTTETGDHGTMTGPWTTSQVVMTGSTRRGAPIQANCPVLWDGGRNFGVWVRTNP